ncbi:winged helix-turn-helix domain-containing protein [Micromonospora sp. SH-82]|uniref:winged helix-turn-helix domain-containing protein n=1 Tax=Micromonospora sp. SH-82 TaxID=3132938 RepID=UPI003EB8CE04
MSVVAISPRPFPPGRRSDRAPVARSGSTSTLTITVDLQPGPVTPRLARLFDLLRELAEAEEGASGPTVAVTGAPPVPVARLVRAVAEPVAPDPEVVQIRVGSRTVFQGGQEVSLTRIEFDLLLFLSENPRRVFTRLQLLGNVWGYEHAVARTVDVHIRRLRSKIGVPLVTTVHGVGYRLSDAAQVTIDRGA